jgi:hypothetical protein
MTTEHTVVRFRQIKKKAVLFKCGRLLANYRDLCLQLPPRAGLAPRFGVDARDRICA